MRLTRIKWDVAKIFALVMLLAVPWAPARAQHESAQAREQVSIKAENPPNHEAVRWHAQWTIEKRQGDWTPEDIKAGRAPVPYEVYRGADNLLMTNGANSLWTALTGGSITAYSNANAYIGVGDSTTTEAASQTDLQSTDGNKTRVAVSSGYPSISTNACTFSASFGSSSANYAWNEWAVFNASSAGTMLDRKVQSMGTKSSGSTWTFTVTVSLS
ncbi:MAG TPA: hypothetical protein VI756_15380 [Blastocatellia bacterium]